MLSRFIFIITLCFTLHAQAFTIIRDDEIESLLEDITTPLLEVAGLSPQSVKLYIVRDDAINAFVAGGQNIFVHTGLLEQADDVSWIYGVMAHEIGHIAGGHLIRTQEALKHASIKTALGYILGAATMAAGAGDVGTAILAGAGHVSQRQLLKYTRGHEESADHAALEYLSHLGYSPGGLLALLKMLNQREATTYGKLNPYVLTHPLSRQRINHIESVMRKQQHSRAIPPQIQQRFESAVVKLKAFLDSPKTTLAFYEKDYSNKGLYAKAIAYHRKGDVNTALKNLDQLIARTPNNPFLIELRGQILFEHGKIAPSVIAYRKAFRLRPDSILFRMQLASVLIASQEKSAIEEAITHLDIVLQDNGNNAFAWRQLAIAYGRKGELGRSNIALAEEALAKDDQTQAKEFILTAEKYIDKKHPAYIHLQDVKKAMEE